MKVFQMIVVTLMAAAMLVAGLWAWNEAREWVLDWGASRHEVAQWAVRSAAITGIAAAEVALLWGVAGRIYRRGTFDAVIGFTAGAIAALASVGAIACGLAGR